MKPVRNKDGRRLGEFNRSELDHPDRNAEDMEAGTDEYYAQLAVDAYGSSVRDNTPTELVAIGKRVDKEGWPEL